MYNILVDIFRPLGELFVYKEINPLLISFDSIKIFESVKISESMKTNEILTNLFNIRNPFPVFQGTHHSPEYDSNYAVLIIVSTNN